MDDIEQRYVLDAYTTIASSFDVHRQDHWSASVEFLKSLPSNSYVLDAGCGNGRNMLIKKDMNIVGFDICPELVQKCKQKNLTVKIGDIRHIPYEDNTFDAVINIAVLGHLTSVKQRQRAMQELIRVTKPYCPILIECWSTSAFQHCKNPEKFKPLDTPNDYLVTYGTERIERYYHLFDYDEFVELISLANVKQVKLDCDNIIGIIMHG